MVGGSPLLSKSNYFLKNCTIVSYKRGRGLVENEFGILNETWSELGGIMELNVKYLPNVITICAI